MALTGIQIFKFLPGAQKTPEANCKKCGCATCMAYAMKLAKGDADINSCPYINEDFKNTFSQENRKPQMKVEFGPNNVAIGDENVMFRHDKTFVNPCGLAVQLSSTDKNFAANLKRILSYKIERVGREFKIDAVALIDDGGDFVLKAQEVLSSDIAVILVTEKFDKLKSISNLIKERKPVIYLKSQDIDELTEAEKMAPIIVDGKNPQELSDKMAVLIKSGAKKIILNLKHPVNSSIVEPLTMIRRSAIEKKFEPLGFPVMVSCSLSGEIALDTINLTTLVCKYVNLIVMDKFNPALLSAIETLKMNIYTDPQKPLQVEPKMYEIGEVTPKSKVMVTTNFALTYFAVVSELESLQEGSYLIITDSDGMSVLTAWSASKFTGEIIAKAVIKSGISEKVKHNNIIIPGLAADLLEEIQEELPEFNIIAGPNEASDLPEFLKTCF